MRIYILSIFIIFNLSFSYGQQLSNEAMSLAQDGLKYCENNDYYNGKIKLEKLLNNHNHELSEYQAESVKEVLRSSYSGIVYAMADNEDVNYLPYCLKGIKIGEELGHPNDMTGYLFSYYIIVYYFSLENEVKMNRWILKLNNIERNLSMDANLKNELTSWANTNIQTMKKQFYSSASSTSVSLSNLFSGISTDVNKSTTYYNKNSSKTIVKKVSKCCNDKILGDKVVIYWAYTNKGEKTSLLYYPHLDKWKFHNTWGEKNRGESFYSSLDRITAIIETE